MRNLYLYVILIALFSSQVYAQEFPSLQQDNFISIPQFNNPIKKIENPNYSFDLPKWNSNSNLSPMTVKYLVLPKIVMPETFINTPYIYERNPYFRDYSTSGAMTLWNNGYLVGSGSFSAMPGLGNLGSATIGISQSFGNLSLYGGVDALKFHMNNTLVNNFGFSSSISYRINERFSLNAFGSYYTERSFHSAAAMTYMGRSNYGGTLTYNINDKWGIDGGVQRYYDTFSRKWVTMPIVSPFIMVNNQKLGFDFGGLLYQIFNNLSENFNGNRDNYAPQSYPKNIPNQNLPSPFSRARDNMKPGR